MRAVQLVEDDELGRRAVEEVGRGVDEKVLVDAEGSVGDAAGRGDLGERQVARLVDEVLAHGDLVDEGGREELAEDLELLRKRGRGQGTKV